MFELWRKGKKGEGGRLFLPCRQGAEIEGEAGFSQKKPAKKRTESDKGGSFFLTQKGCRHGGEKKMEKRQRKKKCLSKSFVLGKALTGLNNKWNFRFWTSKSTQAVSLVAQGGCVCGADSVSFEKSITHFLCCSLWSSGWLCHLACRICKNDSLSY